MLTVSQLSQQWINRRLSSVKEMRLLWVVLLQQAEHDEASVVGAPFLDMQKETGGSRVVLKEFEQSVLADRGQIAAWGPGFESDGVLEGGGGRCRMRCRSRKAWMRLMTGFETVEVEWKDAREGQRVLCGLRWSGLGIAGCEISCPNGCETGC